MLRLFLADAPPPVPPLPPDLKHFGDFAGFFDIFPKGIQLSLRLYAILLKFHSDGYGFLQESHRIAGHPLQKS